MAAYKLKSGDYVVGTVWNDGDPNDPWAIGWYVSSRIGSGVTKHLISDNYGGLFRTDGFRRVKKISPEAGNFLLTNKEKIEQSGRSVYWHLRTFNKSIKEDKEK